jgi:hypothetical protein
VRGIKINRLIWVACVAIDILFVAACDKIGSSKKLSPEAVKQTRLDWNVKRLVGAYQDIGSTDSDWDGFATNALLAFARSRSYTLAPD